MRDQARRRGVSLRCLGMGGEQGSLLQRQRRAGVLAALTVRGLASEPGRATRRPSMEPCSISRRAALHAATSALARPCCFPLKASSVITHAELSHQLCMAGGRRPSAFGPSECRSGSEPLVRKRVSLKLNLTIGGHLVAAPLLSPRRRTGVVSPPTRQFYSRARTWGKRVVVLNPTVFGRYHARTLADTVNN